MPLVGASSVARAKCSDDAQSHGSRHSSAGDRRGDRWPRSSGDRDAIGV